MVGAGLGDAPSLRAAQNVASRQATARVSGTRLKGFKVKRRVLEWLCGTVVGPDLSTLPMPPGSDKF